MSDALQAGFIASRAAALADTPAARLDALAATIEFAPLGIAHFDSQGNLLLANRKLCEILGFPRGEVVRRNFLELTLAEDLPSCLELNAKLAAGEIPSYRHERRFVRADGLPIWTCVTVSAARHTDGRVDFYIGIVEDITDQRRAEELRRHAETELERARDEAAHEEELRAAAITQQVHAMREAERAKRMRDDMLGVLAHGLRNPLHTIALAAGTLGSAKLDAPRRERLLGIIRETAMTMGSILDDLLDMSRLDAGTFAIARDPVSPRTLANAMERLLEARAAQNEVKWSVRTEPYLPDVLGDARRLEQVLSNLIGNALKFTPRGGEVALTCHAVRDGVQFTVTDTGPGIAPHELERLFDRFRKGDPATRAAPGLGLAIARGIVEAHGGRIWAESAPGGGAMLRFVLPVKPS
jgi:PAS domain S-box-containing protein